MHKECATNPDGDIKSSGNAIKLKYVCGVMSQ